jgi:Tfp pilus assembly protein PilV
VAVVISNIIFKNRFCQRLLGVFPFKEQREEGFGLIEVLVASILLLIFSMVILSSSLASLTASSFAKQHSTATSLMTTEVAEAEALGYTSLENSSSFLAGQTDTIAGIKYTIKPTITTANNLITLTVVVTWPSGSGIAKISGVTQIASS